MREVYVTKPGEGAAQANREVVRESVIAILKKTVTDLLPKSGAEITSDDIEAFTQLGLMAVYTVGDEDPRKIFDKVSDSFLIHMASHVENHRGNVAVKNIAQLSLIEWCRRNGHTNGDWAWVWDNKPKAQGHVSFHPKIEMDEALKLLMEAYAVTAEPGYEGRSKAE
jgi:hypothetical protein